MEDLPDAENLEQLVPPADGRQGLVHERLGICGLSETRADEEKWKNEKAAQDWGDRKSRFAPFPQLARGMTRYDRGARQACFSAHGRPHHLEVPRLIDHGQRPEQQGGGAEMAF